MRHALCHKHASFAYSPHSIPVLLRRVIFRTSRRTDPELSQCLVLQMSQASSPGSSTTSWHTGHLRGNKSPTGSNLFHLLKLLHLTDAVRKTAVTCLLTAVFHHHPEGILTSHQCHTGSGSRNCRIEKISVHEHPWTCEQRNHHCRYSLPWDL